jgi:hypothetical protein
MFSLALAVSAVAFLPACDDEGTDPPAATGTLVLRFDHVVGADPLVLNSGTYMNAAGNEYSVSNLEYVISDIEVEAPAALRHGDNFHGDVVHYRTASDDATRSITFTDVPARGYSHLHFRFGLAGAENTAGAFPDLDVDGMAWPSMHGTGYHYMRHEGSFTPDGGGTSNYTTHLGPSMGNDYSIEVELELHGGDGLRHGFEVPADATVIVTIAMDVNEWYTAPNTYDFDDYGFIMGNTAAQQLLHENGADVFSITSVSIATP